MKERKKLMVNKFLLLNIIITIISLIFLNFTTIEELALNFDKNLFIIGWLINIYFVWSIYSIYKMKKHILDFSIVFLLFIFLFCNGQVFLYTLGVDIKQLSVLKISTEYEIIKATIYFYLSLIFYQNGALVCIKKSKNSEIKEVDYLYKKAIKICAVMLIIASIFTYFSILIPRIKSSILYGYNYLYTNSTQYSGIYGYLSKMFIPSLLLLLYTFKDKKICFNSIIIVLLMLIICNLIIGTRGDALSILVILIIFYDSYKKKFEGKKIIKLGLIVLLIMLIIPVIASFRRSENKTSEGLIQNIKENITDSENNFLIKTISELGYTMHSFILTDQVVPEIIDYKHGESYIASILMLIPSQLLGGYSFAEKAALDTWLQNIHQMSYGPGYSIIAETYYNFGFYGGMCFTSILGYFFTKMFNLTSQNNNKKELLKILSLIFLYNSLIVVRFPFHSTPRNIFYMYIIPYFLINSIYTTLKKENY